MIKASYGDHVLLFQISEKCVLYDSGFQIGGDVGFDVIHYLNKTFWVTALRSSNTWILFCLIVF